MNDNQTGGIGKQIKGTAKEATGKLTGNKAGEAEGKVEKNIGKAQKKLGDVQQDNRRDDVDDRP
jgi:uncharacterized protein YjbJ (UPF0337 family)